MTGLQEGRIVKYVLTAGDVDPVLTQKSPIPEGREVVALVVGIVNAEAGVVDLTLFPNWSRDGFVVRGSALPQPLGIVWKQNVEYSAGPDAGKWHWPARPTAPTLERHAEVTVAAV